MARYEHLPIYKAALDAAVHFEKVVAGFSRYHKYTLGTELRHARQAVTLVNETGRMLNGERVPLPVRGRRCMKADDGGHSMQLGTTHPATGSACFAAADGASCEWPDRAGSESSWNGWPTAASGSMYAFGSTARKLPLVYLDYLLFLAE